jgi:hypothetical protein
MPTKLIESGAGPFLAILLLLSPAFSSFPGDPPAKKPTLDEFMAQCGYHKVELEPGQSNHLLVSAKANGKKVVGMVDTGCSGNWLDPEAAPRVRKVGVREAPISGVFGGKINEPIRLVEIERFEVGGLVSSNLPAALFHLAHQENRRQLDLFRIDQENKGMERNDAILGMDFLQRHHALSATGTPAFTCEKMRRARR